MMPSGSSARLIARMASSAGSAVLGREILHLALADAVLAGAGAVHGERALDQPLDEGLGALRPPSASSMSTSSVRWKLPSPTWPTIGATSLLSAMSRWVSVTHSASREIGTQTSVGIILAPGRSVKLDSAASWRACQSRVRSSGLRGPFERPAAELRGDLAEPLATARRRSPSVPWNSRNSIGVSGSASLE